MIRTGTHYGCGRQRILGPLCRQAAGQVGQVVLRVDRLGRLAGGGGGLHAAPLAARVSRQRCLQQGAKSMRRLGPAESR